MTNKERVADWHRTKPDFTHHWTARDWSTAEEVAEALDQADAPEPLSCLKAGDPTSDGHYCTLEAGHAGPCHIVAV